MKVLYACQEMPSECRKSIFLAGPTPRHNNVVSWREEALELLEKHNYDGVVYVPEPQDGVWKNEYDDQITWERTARLYADAILYWVPRDLDTMPAYTTNVEFGDDYKTGKVFYGRPNGAPKTRYLDQIFKSSAPRDNMIHETLEDTILSTLKYLDVGALRRGGEVSVPLHIWKTKQFSEWYKSQRLSGNSLVDSEVLFTFWVGDKKEILFSYVMWVNVWIGKEQRFKSNEFVFSRTDISSIVAFYEPTDNFEDVEVVLVEEFRSPARNKNSKVVELPGGSSTNDKLDPLTVARDELYEETGLFIRDTDRFIHVDNRQISGVLSSHICNVYAIELEKNEIDKIKLLEQNNVVLGEAAHDEKSSSERLHVRVRKVSDLDETEIDWANLGIIHHALSVVN